MTRVSELYKAVQAARLFWYSFKHAGLDLSFALVAQLILISLRHGVSLFTLAALWARRCPNAEALTDDDGALSWQDLAGTAYSWACALDSRMGSETASVALMCRNQRGHVIALLALSRLGKDIVLLSPRISEEELSSCLAQHSIQLIILDRESHEIVLRSSYAGDLLYTDSSPVKYGPTIAQVVSSGMHDRLGRRKAGEIVVFTSGSMGLPKPVARRLKIVQTAELVHTLITRMALRFSSRTFIAVPLCHGYGLASFALCLSLRAPIVIARSTKGARLCQVAESTGAAVVILVPFLLKRMVDAEHRPVLPQLHALVTGSATLTAELCRAAMSAFGPVLFNLYGSTEAGVIAMATPVELSIAPGCAGLPMRGNQVVICSRNGEQVPGDNGEIWVRGPLVLKCANGGPIPEGWKTGDHGMLDGNGLLHVLGRMDDLVNVRGHCVQLQQVEECLATLPGVRDVAIALEDAESQDPRLAVWVVLEGNAPLTSGDVERCLPSFFGPVDLHLLDRLPRNAIGKLQRKRLARSLH